MKTSLVWVGLLVTLGATAGCSGRTLVDEAGGAADSSGSSCVPGRQLECTCFDGTVGAQVCLASSTFGSCSCYGGSAGVGGSPDQPSSVGSGPSSSGGGGGQNDVETQLAAGTSVLIDVFPASSGIFVVFRDTVLLVNRQGQTIQTLAYPREITAAAFDGTTLVIADKAKFTSFDINLTQIVSADLLETCASAVLVSKGRFVCGPQNDWARVFYTYDTGSGALLASSKEYTYNGIPMRRVPGKDDFVTVTVGLSPSDFHLYTVADGGQPVFINESPYHGDFRVTSVYAFDGSPPEHLVTDEGLMLHIYGVGCTLSNSSFDSECFVKDGALGTLSGSQRFIGMDSDGAGKLYGLVDPTPNNFPGESQCDAGCLVQRIDIASHTIEAQSVHHLSLGAVVAARHDAVSGALIIGYRNPGDFYFPDDPYPGYKVVLAKF